MKTNEIKNKNKAEEKPEKLKSWEKRKRNYYFHLALIFKMEIFKVEKIIIYGNILCKFTFSASNEQLKEILSKRARFF